MTSSDPIATPARSRLRVALGAVVVLALVGLAVAVLVGAFGSAGVTRSVTPSPVVSDGSAALSTATDAVIYVHVLGAVNRPGLFSLKEGSRAVDVVAEAGGFTATADQAGLNLARVLSDGEQIIVPELGAAPAPTAGGAGGGAPGTPGGKVNLNSADESTLDALPGIGPATAQSIIKWRDDNGRFSSIEDLMSVGGIGDKTFATLKDLVTV